MTQNYKAKVFISCGQRDGEKQVANKISHLMSNAGFDPYVAIDNNSLQGLTEIIYKELRSSEYFLFIDFKRELLNRKLFRKNEFRGSLFSHQELAIASFLDIKFLGFQELGVERTGILQFLQGNCKFFSEKENLPQIVMQEIENSKWNPNWKNQIIIDDIVETTTAMKRTDPGNAIYYHIVVKNLNPYTHAQNCYSFIERIKQVSTNEVIFSTPVEVKWAGSLLPEVIIPQSSSRKIDAFNINPSFPTDILFNNTFTDSSEFNPDIRNQVGDFDITFLVISNNFPAVRKTFRLHVSENLNDLSFTAI